MPSVSFPAGRTVLTLVGVTLVGTVLVLGLWFPGAASSTDSTPLGTNASERYAALDGLDATETTVIEHGDERRRTVAHVSLRPGTGKQRTVITHGPSRRYERRVSNGTVLWLYDRDGNTATMLPLSPDTDATSRGARIERLFTRLNVTDPDETTAVPVTPGVDPLPVVPHSGAGPPVSESVTGSANHGVSYNGTASVDGRETYVLRLTSAASSGYEQTLWVDTEHFFPLKHRTAWTDDGERVTVTTTYTNVTFDPGLSPETFQFDPPRNATVERPSTPEVTTHGSIAALRASTDISVPDPDLPATFELVYASQTTGKARGVGLQYVNATSTLSVAKYNLTYPVRGGDKRVTVAGREAVLSLGSTVSVSWNCPAYRYTVRGSGVSRERVLAVAESVACS
jgi:outer membrane lipoprotein-sorting protein